MRTNLIVIIFASFFLILFGPLRASSQIITPNTPVQPPRVQEQPVPPPEEVAPEEPPAPPEPEATEEDVEETEEAAPEEEPPSPRSLLPTGPRPGESITNTTPTTENTTEEGEPVGPLKLTFDAVVTMDYTFFNSADTFKVKYHINMNGDVSQNIGIIKTNATTVAEPNGYYAKWPTGQCLLSISIASVPCEIRYRRIANKEVEFSFTFEKSILEDWESMCTFIDAPGKQFNTRGNPEKWFDAAMLKAKPSFKKLNVTISPDETTSLRISIPKHTVTDEGLGSAEVEGLGIITLQPEGATDKVPGLEDISSSNNHSSPRAAAFRTTPPLQTALPTPSAFNKLPLTNRLTNQPAIASPTISAPAAMPTATRRPTLGN